MKFILSMVVGCCIVLFGLNAWLIRQTSSAVDDLARGTSQMIHGSYQCAPHEDGNGEHCVFAPANNSWCEANGERWGENGSSCHAKRSERLPILCAGRDAQGNLIASNVPCTIPRGWEHADVGWLK